MADPSEVKTDNKVIIGTRGSELALAQAHEVRDCLIQAHSKDLEVEVDVISTKGDRITDRPLSEVGGKGLFTEEIEEKLLDGRIDIAVHSTKDMPTQLPEGLELSCFLKREAAEDGFISNKVPALAKLPKGAVVGSSSLRRKALLLRLRPDLNIVEFRGNVQTRLRKLDEGLAEATLLAVAGLNRLDMAKAITSIFDIEEFPPAPGQGAICIESRMDDKRISRLLAPLNHRDTAIALECERSFLAALDGSCRTPIAGHAKVANGKITFHGMILLPDGSQSYQERKSGSIGDAAILGREVAEILRRQAGSKFFDSWT